MSSSVRPRPIRHRVGDPGHIVVSSGRTASPNGARRLESASSRAPPRQHVFVQRHHSQQSTLDLNIRMRMHIQHLIKDPEIVDRCLSDDRLRSLFLTNLAEFNSELGRLMDVLADGPNHDTKFHQTDLFTATKPFPLNEPKTPNHSNLDKSYDDWDGSPPEPSAAPRPSSPYHRSASDLAASVQLQDAFLIAESEDPPYENHIKTCPKPLYFSTNPAIHVPVDNSREILKRKSTNSDDSDFRANHCESAFAVPSPISHPPPRDILDSFLQQQELANSRQYDAVQASLRQFREEISTVRESDSARDDHFRRSLSQIERHMAELQQRTDDYFNRVNEQIGDACIQFNEIRELSNLRNRSSSKRIAHSELNVMKPVSGESKYCKGFDYTAMSKQIDQLRDELIELKYNEPVAISRVTLDMIQHERKLFANSIEFAKTPEDSQRKTKPRSRKNTRLAKENADPNTSQFFTNLMMNIGATSAKQVANSDLANRPYVRQTRSRPQYLDEYIKEIHSKQLPRPELNAIDEPVRVQYRSSSPAQKQIASSNSAKSNAEIQSERLECDQATITESVLCRTDSATSPPPPFILNEQADDNAVNQLAPVPFSILDLEPFEEINDVSVACDFLSRTKTNTHTTPNNPYLVNINDETLLTLILQMFSASILSETRTCKDQTKYSKSPESSDTIPTPLVKVSVDVITSLSIGSEVTFPRLSVEVLNTASKYIIYAEPCTPSLSDEMSSCVESECDYDAQATEPDRIGDDTCWDSKYDSKEQLLTVIPVSPRLRQNNARRSLSPRGLELRLSSPSRSVAEAEVVKVEEFASHNGMHLEEYEEIQDDDVLAESQLVQPFVQKDIVEVMIIVSPEIDEVSVAIKIVDLPSICFGPRLFRNRVSAVELEQEIVPQENLSSSELECDIQSEESGLVCPQMAISKSNVQNKSLVSYIQGFISDRSVSSEESDNSSTTETDTDSVMLGFGSVFSSGEIMPSNKDGYSDGEVASSALFGNRMLLGYLSDSTDTGSLE